MKFTVKKQPTNIADAILAADKSLEGVRAAFSGFAQAVLRQQRVVDQKIEQHELGVKNGARTTKHRFHL